MKIKGFANRMQAEHRREDMAQIIDDPTNGFLLSSHRIWWQSIGAKICLIFPPKRSWLPATSLLKFHIINPFCQFSSSIARAQSRHRQSSPVRTSRRHSLADAADLHSDTIVRDLLTFSARWATLRKVLSLVIIQAEWLPLETICLSVKHSSP